MDAAQLKAAGFTDQEIKLHQAGFSDDEIKGAKPKPATFLSTLGRAAWNLPADAMDTLKNIDAIPGKVMSTAAHAVLHPQDTVNQYAPAIHNAADILGGALQHARDMSPANLQGSAPKMDTAAFDKYLQGVHDKYGTKQGIYKEVGDHPVGALMTAASVAAPALKLVGATDALADASAAAGSAIKSRAAPIASRIATPINRITSAERTATAAADTMRADTGSRLADARVAAAQEATDTSDRAARAAALANRARTQGKTLDARRAAAAAEAVPPEPAIGQPAHLSEIGDSIRTPALANEDALNVKMREADGKYRTAMQQVADDRAAAGVGVSDTPLAKAMIKQSQAIVSPNPVTRPAVGNVPMDSAGAKLHKQLLDVLQPQPVPLTDVEAAKAVKAGVNVQTGADGSKYRVIKPDLSNVDDFRRFLGKVLNGDVEGYAAINRTEAQNMYGNLAKVIDRYVQGASKPVQANWRAGKQALAPFENVRAGQAIVGTQAGTNAASVPAANLPGRIISGGRDTLKQAAIVAGDAPVASALRSQVQNALTGKTADAAEAAIRPGTTLGDAINTDDGLTAAVRAHIQQVRQAEQRGVDADTLARRSATAMSRSTSLDKAASALQSTSEKAALKARGYQQEISALEVTQPRQVGSKYVDVLNRAHADGSITTDQLSRGLQLAAGAEKAFALKATRDAWLKQAAITLGVTSGLGVAGVGVLHTAGH
jgi:hypothetical protein